MGVGGLGDLEVGDTFQPEGPRGGGREWVALGCFGVCLSLNKQEVQDVRWWRWWGLVVVVSSAYEPVAAGSPLGLAGARAVVLIFMCPPEPLGSLRRMPLPGPLPRLIK